MWLASLVYVEWGSKSGRCLMGARSAPSWPAPVDLPVLCSMALQSSRVVLTSLGSDRCVPHDFYDLTDIKKIKIKTSSFRLCVL